jgi:hypothetical protein
LIPTLESYNPRFRDVIWRTSRSLAGDYEILSEVLDEAWKRCVVEETGEFVAFDEFALTQQPLGLQRNLVRRAMERLHPEEPDISYATLERASNFIADPEGHRRVSTDLTGGVHLLREGTLIYMVASNVNLPIERWPQMPDADNTIPLRIPSQINLSGGWKLNCERWNIASLALSSLRTIFGRGWMPMGFRMRWSYVSARRETASSRWGWMVMW